MMEEKIKKIFMQVCGDVDFESEALITNRVIDSIQVIELVTIIMQELGIKIPYEEIVPENFNSLNKIISLAKRYS